MPQVFSSVKEALLGVLSGTVNPVRVTTSRRASCPNIDTHRASSRGGRSGPGASRITKKEEEEDEEGEQLEWNVIVLVPDDEEIDRKEIDIRSLTDQDLCKLKTEDPFLYYSIPSIRRKSYLFDESNDVDAIKSSTSRRSSLPADFRSRQDALYQDVHEDTRRRESIVRRTSRLSTEAHPSLILEEMMLHELLELDGDDSVDDDDMDDAFEHW
ncbi:MAG: hypothetical protein J0651_04890 [Actinobacteria bacterium]|nr:hypothetical protein [Actinomycetota bacterium]